MGFWKIINDIKSVKIQGAENTAIYSVKAIKSIINSYKSRSTDRLINKILKSKEILFSTRPTEPCMRNSLNYVTYKIYKYEDLPIKEFKKEINKRMDFVFEHFKHADEEIAKIGSRKIKSGMTIFTHCHSTNVVHILKKAKDLRKNFIVHNTETRPLYQGRITARELSSHGINVKHYVDSGARIALKKADLMLIGCDVITSEGKIINKIGSEMFAEIADKYNIPVYVASDSWKYDPRTMFGYEEKIEMRSPKEVWPNHPKNVKIMNYAFEKINPDLITGIICEKGIYPPQIFIREMRSNEWMF